MIDELGKTAAALDPAPVSVILFGSLARGDSSAFSDIDLIVVRPDPFDEDDEDWRYALDNWRIKAERLTGNLVEVLEIAEHEVGALLRRRAALWQDVIRDGVCVFGATIEQIRRTAVKSS